MSATQKVVGVLTIEGELSITRWRPLVRSVFLGSRSAPEPQRVKARA